MILYQHHLPSEVRIITFAGGPIVMNPDVAVFDAVTTGAPPVYCRSYLFLKRWLQVFMTMNADRSLKPDGGDFPFVFNCDITTPHYPQGDTIYTSDLLIDVLVNDDGRSHMIKDTEEFEKMHRMRQFGDHWYQHAKDELAFLTSLLETNCFIQFLNSIAPFDNYKTDVRTVPCSRCDIRDIHFRYHPLHPRFE